MGALIDDLVTFFESLFNIPMNTSPSISGSNYLHWCQGCDRLAEWRWMRWTEDSQQLRCITCLEGVIYPESHPRPIDLPSG